MGAEVKLIINFATGRPVCERTVIADHALRRMRGLLGRRSLEPGDGMLLRPAPSIHTAFMRFPIDVVFVDADLCVVDVVENLRPWRVAAKRHSRSALELAAGEVERRGVGVGDRLVVLEAHGAWLDSDSNATGNCDHADEVLAEAFLPNVEVAPAIDRFAPDGEQRSLRVLVIAQDRRFRTVASALLARRGCAVASTPSANRVVDSIARERTDVVVIDAGALLTAAARTVATVAAIEPPVGVVLVGDDAETGLQHMPVLAKWGPFEEFFTAIEQANRDRGRRSRLVG